jgi:hypothetical protein
MYHFAMSLVGEFLVNKRSEIHEQFSQVLHVKKAPFRVVKKPKFVHEYIEILCPLQVVRSPNLFMNILKYCEKIICISI